MEKNSNKSDVIESEKMNENCQVCFSIHDVNGDYVKYLGVAITSLLRNASIPIVIHILYDDTLSEKDKGILSNIIEDYNASVLFHSIKIEESEYIDVDFRRHTIGALFRLKICDILEEINRIIYLDADIVVNMDIKQLWEEDLGNNAIGGVVPPEFNIKMPICENGMVSYEEYINSGMLLINMKKLKKLDFFESCTSFIKSHARLCRSLDQDAINYVLKNKIKKLDMRYNTSSVFARRNADWDDNRIYHFYADCPRDTFEYAPDRLFYKYLSQTPWGAIDKVVHHYEKRLVQKDYEKECVYRLLNCLYENQDRHTVFWGVGGGIHKKIMNKLPCRKNYYFVDSDEKYWGIIHMGAKVYPPEKIKNELRDDIIIIVTIFRYKEVKDILEKYDFVENVHFFNGKYLLPENELYLLSGERDCKWDL